MVSANVPCCSSQARTQREQTMHLLGIEGEVGIATRPSRRVEVIRALVAVAHFAQADDAGHVLQLAVAVGGAGEAVERMIGDVQLHHAAAHVGELLVLGRAPSCPAATGVVQEAGQPLHALDLHQAQAAGAEGLQLSVAHSFGILMPASAAARITEVPSGTVTSRPSISSVTGFWRCRAPGCRDRVPTMDRIGAL